MSGQQDIGYVQRFDVYRSVQRLVDDRIGLCNYQSLGTVVGIESDMMDVDIGFVVANSYRFDVDNEQMEMLDAAVNEEKKCTHFKSMIVSEMLNYMVHY